MSEGSGTPSDFAKKRVDESWKDSVLKEKVVEPEPAAAPAADFISFLSLLAMQTLSALGEIPPPGAEKPVTDLLQAQYLIDTMQMLSEKTRGNLSQEEAGQLEALLYELRVKFVQKKQGVSA